MKRDRLDDKDDVMGMIIDRLHSNSSSFTYLELGKTCVCTKGFLSALEKNRTMTTVMIASCFFSQFFQTIYCGENIESMMDAEKEKLLDEFFTAVLELGQLRYVRISLRQVPSTTRRAVSAKFADAVTKNCIKNKLKLSLDGVDLNVFLTNLALLYMDQCQPLALQIDSTNSSNPTVTSGMKLGLSVNWVVFGQIEEKKLTNLTLASNEIGNEDCKAIAASFCFYTTITSLNLSENQVGADGCKELAKGLKTNSTLEHLNLSRNNIDDEGVRALAEGLRHNDSLCDLNLSCNDDIGKEGWKALAKVLEKSNSTLKSVGNRVPDKLLKFYLRLNKVGRHKFVHSNLTTREDRIETLVKVRGNVRCMYYFLCCRPELCDLERF